ncbi:MAG: hypothetical protein ACO1OO_06845 [Flavisolibacter sp.]
MNHNRQIFRVAARRSILLFSILSLVVSIKTTAQAIRFKTYADTTYKFSFDIPTYWTVEYSKEHYGIVCKPITEEQQEIYKTCFEGVVFRMEVYDYGIDSLLLYQFEKKGDYYITSDRTKEDVPVTFIHGKDWKGIRHTNVCGISCIDDGFHAGAGECEFVYFCKDDKTIEIATSGRVLEDEVITRLLSSFTFID